MAEDRVVVPIDLTVTDIKTGDIKLGDVQKSIESRLSGIAKSAGDILGNIDTSKMNKELTSSMNDVMSSYQKFIAAQSKLNEAMRTAGSSSPEFRKQLKAIQTEIARTEEHWESFGDLLLENPILQSGLNKKDMGLPLSSNEADAVKFFMDEADKYEAKMSELRSRLPRPHDFLDTSTTTEMQKLVTSYQQVFNAIGKVEAATDKWNDTVQNNSTTDEYQELAKSIETAEQKLSNLQTKAQRMESLGASDGQWESLIYDAEQLKNVIGETELKMIELVKSGEAFRFGDDSGDATKKEYAKLNDIVNRLKKTMQNISGMKPNTMYTEEYAKQVKELESLERSLESYKDKFNKMQAMGAPEGHWKSFLMDIQMLESKIVETTNKLREMVSTGKAFRLGTGDSTAELNALNSRLQSTIASMEEMTDSPKHTRTNVMGLISATNQFCQGAEKGITNILGMFKKLGSAITRTGKSSHKSLGQMVRDLMMVAFGVGSLLFLIREVRRLFISAFQEMATQIPEINDDISLFIRTLNQVKGSIATAFQPIVSAVIPWLNQLSAVLVQVTNAIGRFFATLTGQGYIYKFTAAQVDYAESLDTTASSAKKAQKSLMGFDEINRLNGNEDTSGGAGSGNVPTGTWDKEMLDGMNTLAQLMKEAWTDGDFAEVGQYIGEKLLGALEIANTWITSKGFAYAEKIGKSFATLINGFVDTDNLGAQIGTTLSNAINMALTGLHTFLTTTNWLSLGQFIADWANASVKTFDWILLGQTIADVIMAGVNTWWQFVGEFDFASLGQNLSNSINTFFDDLLAVDETGLSGAEKLGQAISDTILGIINSLSTLVRETDWSDVGTAIGEMIGSIDWFSISWNFNQLISAFIGGLADAFVSWAATDPLSASIVSVFTTALLGIKIVSVFTSFLGIFEQFVDNVDDLMSFKEILGVVGKFAKVFGGITAIVSGVVMFFTNFFAMLKNGFNWLNEIFMVIGIALGVIGAIILGAPAAIAAVIGAIIAVVATLVVVIKDNWQAICEFFQSAWQAICDFFVGAWEWIKEVFTSAGEAISTWWTDTWTAIKTFFVNLWTTIYTNVKTVITAIKTTISNIINQIKTTWTNIWTGIKTTVTNIWNGIKTTISNVINGIKTTISNIVTKIATTWSNAWNNMRTIVTNIWNGIKNTITKVINGIIGGINGMIRGVVNGINAVIGLLNKLKFDIPDWVPGFGGKKFGFSINTLTAPQIPYLAKGAVIPPNKEFMAVLGDQKHGTNIEAPLDTIKQAVAEELSEYIDAMMTGFQAVVDAVNDKDLDVRIGDSAIGKAAERYSRRQALVRGTV